MLQSYLAAVPAINGSPDHTLRAHFVVITLFFRVFSQSLFLASAAFLAVPAPA